MASTRSGRILRWGGAVCLGLAGCGSGGGPAPATKVALLVEAAQVFVPEGTTARIGFRLTGAPAGDLGVTARLATSAASLSIQGASDFLFTPGDWDSGASVTLRADDDADAEDGYGTLTLTLDGSAPVTVSVMSPDKEIPDVPGVRLTVKDASSRGAIGWPVTAVVPLPYGAFQDTGGFRVVDASGSPIPAQFHALNRWWRRGNSIRHVVAHFDASVAPDGRGYYFLQSEDGPGPPPARPVRVQETAGRLTVDTGAVRFSLHKTAFNLFDEVFVDADGDGAYAPSERIVAPGASEGPVFTGRLPLDVQRARDRADLAWEVEESGPVRAVIRVGGLGSFRGMLDHRHGFAARVYAYAGKPFVKVDYQLQNSPKDARLGWPLYFEDVSLHLRPALSGATARLSVVPSTVHRAPVADGGVYLFADSLTEGSVRRSAGDAPLVTGTVAAGYSSHAWADLADAQRGVAVVVRHWNEMWPIAVELSPDGNVSVRLWPRQSAQFVDGALSPTGLYWLEDMQHVVKEALFWFHGPGVTEADLDALAANFTWHPIAVVQPAEYHRTRATLDLDGILPSPAPLPGDDLGRDYWMGHPGLYRWAHDFSRDPALPTYAYGWASFEGDTGRKVAGVGGGFPLTGADAIGTGFRDRWYRLERQAWGELNARPQWMAGYDHEADGPFLELSDAPYGSASWRAYDNNDVMPLAFPYLPGTQFGGWYARDNAHAWFWDLEEHYLLSANLWLRDWYEFVAQFRQRELRGLDRVGRTDIARHEAEYVANALQAFRATGDPELWEALTVNLANLYDERIVKQTGTMRVEESTFQIGFLARTTIDFLVETRGFDHDVYATCWNLLWGFADWNAHLARYGYYVDGLGTPNTVSIGSGMYLADPMAWFYLQSGRREHLDLLRAFAETGLDGGERPYMDLLRWSGDFVGRVTQVALEAPKPSETPPAPIADLAASLVGGEVAIRWTAPARASRYHVVWDTVPLSPSFTRDAGLRNLWAAHPVGTALVATPGAPQSLAFAVPQAGSGDTVYVAVVSFDAEDNMSASSNVAQVAVP